MFVIRAKKVVYLLSKVLGIIGQFFILVLALFTTIGSILRYAFNCPILGDLEITELIMAVIVASLLAYTQINKSHIVMDLLMSRFSQRTQSVIDSIIRFFCIGIVLLIVWQTFVYAKIQLTFGQTTGALSIPVSPFVFMTVVGWGILCLVYIVEILDFLLGGYKR